MRVPELYIATESCCATGITVLDAEGGLEGAYKPVIKGLAGLSLLHNGWTT